MNIAALALVVGSATAFTTPSTGAATFTRSTSLNGLLKDDDWKETISRQVAYSPGTADNEFARRFGSLAGKKIKTVGEAFTDFTRILGHPINALYRSTITDIVGSAHLSTVDARFARDPVWCLGIMAALELLLKNYPEKDISAEVVSAIFESIGMDQAEVEADAAKLGEWAQGKTRDEIAAALKGEGDSELAATALLIKGDQYWMYSRYFGIGLVKLTEKAGIEQSMETAFPIMEDWVGKCLEKPFYTACSDSDLYFRTKAKLDMMETLMKEIEIREKKRMADRLEEKAEQAIARAEREEQLKAEKAKEEAEKDASSS